MSAACAQDASASGSARQKGSPPTWSDGCAYGAVFSSALAQKTPPPDLTHPPNLYPTTRAPRTNTLGPPHHPSEEPREPPGYDPGLEATAELVLAAAAGP